MDALLDRVLQVSACIRYVAVYSSGRLSSAVREGIENASATESDKYEELLVNPTLVTLARQRGNIDCGGLHFLLVRYGSFYELILPLADGHLSVGIEPGTDPLALVPAIQSVAITPVP